MKSYFQEAMKQNLERDAKEKKAQQSNQASAPRTKRNLVAPFKTDYLNQKYKDAVADLGQYTSPRNAIEEAYKAVSTMRDTVFAYDGAAREKDAKAAILAGEKQMNKSLRESRTRFQLEGKSYGEMIALAKSKGYRDARENLQDMARRGLVSDQQAAMAIASGDEGGTEAERHVKRWADALKSYKGNAQDYFSIYQDPAKAMQALRDDKTMRAMTFEQQDILTELLQESGALDSFDTAEQEKLAADYAAREMTYMQEAMRSLQNQEEWQDIIDYSRKNTLEGAREWVESEPESQEAKNNLYFAEKKAEYDAIAPGADDYDANNGDRLYQYINGNKQIIDDANLVANMAGGSDPWYKYRYMTEDQVKKYNAIVKQKGLEEGKKYLDEYLSYALNERQNEEAKQQMYDLAQSGPVGAVAASAASVPMNLARGFGYADVLLQKLMNRLTGSERPVDYNRSLNQIGAGADAARQGVMDSVDWNINVLGRDVDVFDFLYGTAMSGADSLAAGAFGQTMGAVILGSSAAQSTMQDVHERGGNDGQALVSGLAAGIFEELFEKVSLGNLFADFGSMNKEGLKGALKMIAREMGVNFSEEFFTEVANVAFDKIYMGDLSKVTKKYEYYRILGLTDEQASAKLASDIGAQFLEAGLGGAVMGAEFGAAGAVNATRNNSKVTKQAGDNIIQAGTRERLKKIASAFGEDSEAGRMAKTYNAETAESKETGKLFRAVLEEMPQGEQRTVKFREDMMGLVAAEVEERLLELGENEGDAADAAMAVTALWANAELEAADYLALSRSDHAIELAEQLLGMEAADASQSAESAANAEQDAWDAEQDITNEVQAGENAADAAARALEAEGTARRTEKREAPARISLDDEGGVKIQENGKEIDLDESAMTDSQKTLVLDSQGMQPETAAAMRGAYAEGGDVSAHEYGIGFKRAVEAYKRGETPTGVYAGALTETQLEAARAAAEGENARAREQTLQAAQETAQALGLRALTEETKNEAGVVIASAKGKPDEFQAAQIKLVDRVAKELGVQVRLYDTLKSPGGAKANASYAQGTNIINLALDADKGLLTKAVSHELYHFLKEWNAEGAERLSALVLGTLEGKEGYDLKARIQEKIAEYEEGGVILTEAAAREEIVGDGLLDYIGTEENFSALAKADRSLAEQIKSWVSEMAGRIRRLIGELTGKEAEALRDDLRYLEARDKMMQGVLQKAAENLRDAQRGMYGSAKTDTAVKEYQADMRNAMNAQEREEALNGLVSKMMERTQRAYFAAHPEADLTDTMEKMKRGLLAYGQGKTDVETALKKEGLSAPRAGTHTMYVMSYIGQQAALLEEQGQKYSIETFEKNGRTFSYVKAERQVITGDDPQAWGKQVENYINSEIRKGKDVTFYTENGVPLTVTKDTAGKATYWNTDQSGNRVSEKEYGIKLRIESHIDEAAQVSKGKGNQKIDKKSHSFANNGWNYRKAFFEDFDGNYYSFEISVGKNGEINTIYNVNNIKKEAESPNTLKGAQPKKTTVGLTASTPSISEDSENVNGKFSLSSEVEEQNGQTQLPDVTEDAELSAQAAGDEDMRAALMLVQRLYDTARNGEGYLALNGRGAIQAGDWQKRVEGIRDRLLSETGSGYGKGALTRRLNTLFAAMDEGTQSVGDLLMYARETGKKLLENADWAKGVQDEATAEALRILKTNKFYLTEDMKSEIRGTFGSVQNFMRKNFGKLAIRAKAANGNAGANVSLAEVWTESLSDLMPGTFTADATEADMPIILNAWLETVQGRENSNYYGNNIPQMETDIGLQLMLDYYNLPGALKSAQATETALLEEYESKLRDIRQQYRRKYEEQVSRGAARESKRKTLGEISRNVKYLNTRIVNESDTRHVPDALKGAVTRFMDSFLNDTSVFDRERLRELRDAYARMRETGVNEDSQAAWAYDDDIKNMLERMEKTIAGRGLSQLTQDELEMVRDVVGNLKKMVVEGNEITINGRKQTVDHAGNMALTELKSKENVKHEKLTNARYRTTTPFYFFKNLGGEFKTLFDDMRKGQGKWSGMMGKAKEYLDAQLKEHHVNDWLWTGDNLVFTTDRGEKIELDKGLAMALYATWKRETLNKAQNANHLRMGGFMYPKWAQEKIKTQGVDVNRPHALTAGDMAKIESYLGKSGIGFVDGMVKYLSNEMAQAGNEVSMALFGYRKFTEGYYFPYASSREYIATDVTRGPSGESQEKTLKSWGAAKKLTERANNPIMIDSFIDVWAKHVNQMATYSSFTVAMDNMNRLYNYKTGVMEDATPESVRVELKRAFGEGAEKYIANLMKDIAGGMRPDERAGMGKMLSLFKKGAVSASASVTFQQPSAIMRAMALISPKYFVDAPKNPMKSWRELTEYSGVARVKEMGRFDTMTGQSSTEWLTSDVKDESAWKRAADFADNLAGWAPEKADQVTWGKLWETVKKEQEAAGVDITTKEGLQKCGERFDEVADATQVYDSVLSKSEIMRGQTIAAKMITAFMAEPTVSFNLLADAIMHMGDTTYQGRVTVKRAAAAYTANVILNAMLKALITGFRKDDDNEKTAVERYVAEVAENIMSDMNPLTLIPWVQDAVNIFQGYDVKRTDMTVVSDLYEGVKTLFDENKSLEQKVEKGLGGIAAIFGVPLRNIARDARTLMNLFNSRPISETDASAIRYGVLEGIPGMPGIFTPYESKNAAYYQRMANAYFADDAEEYENLRRYMTTRKGATENAVSTGARNAVKRMLLAGKIDEDQALQYLMDMEEKSASDAYWMIQEWMGGDDYAKYDDFYEAVNTGKGLQAAIRNYTENGVEKKTLASRITAEYKEEYIRLYKADKRKFTELQARLLTAYAALGYDREKKKKDMEAWLKEK